LQESALLNPAPTPRRRRLRALLLAVALAPASLAFFGVPAPALRAAGAMLVADDPLPRADVIVVATGSDGAGTLEAADLVKTGVAPRVAVFADPPDPVVDREFLRRGIPYEDAGARMLRQLKALGVETTEEIPRAVAGTSDEGKVLPEWCARRGFRAVVVVTTADHSRRLRRVLRRSMHGHATLVTVRAARFSPFDPERWWETRQGTRTQLIELQKLMLDVVLHPLS
jgi:hypothetical protein